MARATIKMPVKALNKLSNLEKRTQSVVESVLKSGGDVALHAVKQSLDSVVDSNSGQLKHALGLSPVKVDDKGVYDIKVGFAEPRKVRADGLVQTNAMVANIIEHGKTNQAPRPFLARAKATSQSKVKKEMIKTLEREVSGVK